MKSFITRFIIPVCIVLIASYIITTLPYDTFNKVMDFNEKYEKLIYLIVIAIVLFITFLPSLLSKLIKPKYQKNLSLQDTSIEFDNIYNNLYDSNILALEKMRKKAKARRTIEYILGIVIVIGLIFARSRQILISENVDLVISIICTIAIIIAVILELFNYKSKKEYINAYKNSIVSNFIKLVSNNLTYNPDNVDTEQISDDYKNANFDDKSFNSFKSDDHIEGHIENNIYIKVDDILVQKITAAGSKYEEVKDLFHGIFAYTKADKNINTYIKITKNKYKLFKDETKVEMDNSLFEKIFDIHTENKILAMRILTTDIMNCLIDFYNKYQLDFEIVFRDNNIYLRFFTGAMFEPKIFGNSMDKELLVVYYSILKFVVDITKKVNLTLQDIDI